MLSIRSLSPCVASRLTGLALIVLLAGVAGWASADRLPANGVEDFRRLLDQERSISAEDEPAIVAQKLAQHLHDLREAAAHLSSLGEVTHILLLPEWGTSELSEPDTNVTLDRVEAAVRKPDSDSFKREAQRLLEMAGDKPLVVQLIADEMKRDVRLALLQRLEQGLHRYLRAGRTVDRIAAANLISQTMFDARKQGSSEIAAYSEPRKPAPQSSRFLRQRLREFSGDLQKLTGDTDAQVQVAAVRALSELESDPAATVATLKPLLTDGRSSVAVRRATAQAFAQMIDLAYQQWKATDRSRPLPPLKALVQIFPAAAAGLADSDTEVRRVSLLACQRAVTTLDDLVGDRKVPLGGLSAYNPMVAALQKSLSELNRAARDSDPELRVAACHLLETLVGVAQKVRHLEEMPAEPDKTPAKEPSKRPAKKVKPAAPLSSFRGVRRPVSPRPSQWAATRMEQPSRTTLLAPVPLQANVLTPAVTLDRPVKWVSQEQALSDRAAKDAVRPAAFMARQPDELPPPAPLTVSLKGTIDAMRAGLSDPDFRVRLASVDVLETFGARATAAIPDLVKAMSDPNKFVRWASARTLGRLAPRQAKDVVPGLMRLLNDREDQSVRIAAAHSLELYGPDAKEAVPLLARILNRGDKEYIIALLHTIQGIGTDAKRALPSVAWILKNRALPASVRVEAAQTLGRFGPLAFGQVRDLREVMVNDASEEVRNAASIAVLAVDRPK
jgi:HEAT repeat protein